MPLSYYTVFGFRLGLFGMAASGAAVRQASCLSDFNIGNDGEHCSPKGKSSLTAGNIQAIQIWAPRTKTSGQWIANKVLQGFFGAPIESLCEISVTDIVHYPLLATLNDAHIVIVLYT